MSGTSYWAGSPEIVDMVDEAMTKWHGELKDAGVRVGVLMAFNDKKAAVNHGGYPAAATIRIIPLRDRVSKGYDAELTIDATSWKERDKAGQNALLDHELCHLGLKKRKKKKSKERDSAGELVEDDGQEEELVLDTLGRPMLMLKKGDWNGGDGFQVVVHRHKNDAQELKNAQCVLGMIQAVMDNSER